MRTIISITIFASLQLFSSPAMGQFLEPAIKFTLHFEDAGGLKDSVVIGFDSLANPYIDSAFGEVDLWGVPYDSVFEARGADMGGDEYISKIMIHGYRSWMCEQWTQYQSVVFHARDFPVRISWDSTYFKDQCYDWTHFTRSWYYMFHPSIFDGNIIRLRYRSSFLVTKDYLHDTETWRTSYVQNIEGGTQDTVYVIFVGLAGAQPADAVSEAFGRAARIFPNPATGLVHLELPEGFGIPERIRAFDAAGRELQPTTWSNPNPDAIEADIGDWPPGLYLLHVTDSKGRSVFARLVKI